MFCPKCGTKNPENGKFCRGCGTDLSIVTEALSGNINYKNSPQWNVIQPIEPVNLSKNKGKSVSLENAFGKLFTGIAFLIVSIALAFSKVGQHWWFWMLIPAFSMLGAGIAQLIQLRKNEKKMIFVPPMENQNVLREPSNAQLSPSQTAYVKPQTLMYDTGELVPPSVIEGTTRHLKINREGETMTLPKKENL